MHSLRIEALRVGFSSVTIDCSTAFDGFWQLSPQCLELCRIGLDAWPHARDFVTASPVPVGLHCPLPFDGLIEHFEITGPNSDRQAQELVHRTLSAAAAARAAYVVVHFPTVFDRFNGQADWQLDTRRYIGKALEMGVVLESMSQNFGVPILIENVGFNPHFHTGSHFRQLFEGAPTLRMCLDPGHAHVLAIGEDVYTFTEAVAPYVSAVHLYNTNSRIEPIGHHYPPAEDQLPLDGWMDLRRILGLLADGSFVKWLIFEYVGTAEMYADHKAGIEWMRKEIAELRWR